MRHPRLITLAFVLAVLFVTPVAFAQTSISAAAVGVCAPATPCTDPGTRAAFTLSSIAVQTAAPAVDAAAETLNPGFGLAWAVMALMVVSLLYAVVAAVFATLGRTLPSLPAGSFVLIPILSVLGLAVALYLTYVETQNVAAVCGPVGDCNAVQSSPFAKLFGFLPVGLLGALGYVGILATWFAARSAGALSRLAALLMFGMALFGVLFTIYLTYLELFVINAVCIWCLASAVLMAFVLALSVRPALEALQAEDDYEPSALGVDEP